MYLLFENFRKYLKEDISESQGWCLQIRAKGDGKYVYFLLYDGKMLVDSIDEYITKSVQNTVYHFVNEGIAIGMIKSEPIFSDKGNCYGAKEIGLSAVNKMYRNKGYGTLLYKMIMAYSAPQPTTGDRGGTSKLAQKVYDRLPATSKDFDDIGSPKTPPEEDDCYVSKNTINKAYYLNPDEISKMKSLMEKLTKNHKTTLSPDSHLHHPVRPHGKHQFRSRLTGWQA